MSDRHTRDATVDWTTTSLGERVEYAARLRGWSLNRLGEEAGLATGVMSRLARRAAQTAGAPDTLARVADAARVNVLWLMLGRGPIEIIEPNASALRNHRDWPTALAEAKKWQRGIPEDFWQLAGDSVVAAPPRLDWQLIVGLVRELYSSHQRWQAEAERGDDQPASSTTENAPARSTVRSNEVSGRKKRAVT